MHRNRSFTIDFKSIKPHLPLIICFLILIIGILAGCLIVGNQKFFTDLFAEKLKLFIAVRSDGSSVDIILNSFKNIFPYYILVFLVGTSVVGCALSPCLLMFYGFSYGCISGILYSTYNLEGIMFNSLIFMPCALFCAFGLVLLVKDSISFSYLLSGICIKSNKPINIYSDFKAYCIRGLVSLIAAFTALAFDFGMSTLFMDYFNI